MKRKIDEVRLDVDKRKFFYASLDPPYLNMRSGESLGTTLDLRRSPSTTRSATTKVDSTTATERGENHRRRDMQEYDVDSADTYYH